MLLLKVEKEQIMNVEIGSGTFIDKFEDQLIGYKAGDSKDINVTSQSSMEEKKLNGKTS